MRRAPSDRGERGAVLVFMALLMVGLLVMAAIVIDIGNARQNRRRAQNAVDAAALAAAADYDGSSAGATAARTQALAFLDVNDFEGLTGSGDSYSCGNGETCSVILTFSPAPVAAPPTPDLNTRFCVRIDMTNLEVGTYFAGVIGADRIDVGVTANGCRRFSGGGANIPGLLTTGDDCTDPAKMFVTSGQSNLFEGGIHSNYDAKDNGNGNTRTGSATYVDVINENNGLWDGATQVAPQTNPFAGVTASLYAPGGLRAAPYDSVTPANDNYFSFTGDQDFSGNMNSGIYYTTGKTTISGPVTILPHNGHTGATFVTGGGIISLSATDILLQHFDDDPSRLVLFSDYDEAGENCDKESIQMSGNCIRIDGVVYASRGKFRLSGEGNGHDYVGGSICGGGSYPHTTFNGGFAAWAIEWSGNLGVLRSGSSGTATSPDVYLDE